MVVAVRRATVTVPMHGEHYNRKTLVMRVIVGNPQF